MQFEIRKCVCVSSERERDLYGMYIGLDKVHLGFSFSANPIQGRIYGKWGFHLDLDSVKDDKQSKSQIRVINIIHYIVLSSHSFDGTKQQEGIRMRQIPFLAYTRFHFHFQELQRSYLKTSIRN